MKAHIIENSYVANTIVVASLAQAQALYPSATCIDADQYGGAIGWTWDAQTQTLSAPTTSQADLDAAIAAAIAKTYTDVDAVYADAVGNRESEYKDAEAEARAFKAAGYTGEPGPFVVKFASRNPTLQVQTAQWSADSIIARADALNAAKLSMRDERFDHQYYMRMSATSAALDAAIAAWDAYIATLRTSLGI